MTKRIDTLIEDIYQVLLTNHTISEDNLQVFSANVARSVKRSLEEVQQEEKANPL